MAETLHIEPYRPEGQGLLISHPEIPDSTFVYVIPEMIGSTEHVEHGMEPAWFETDGGWGYDWEVPGRCRYEVRAVPFGDHVDVRIRLVNTSSETWPDSMDFSCLNPMRAETFRDYDGNRTFVRKNGEWVPITRLERKTGPRPTIQLYYAEGAAKPVPFVENFQSTPGGIEVEGVLAVESWDRKHAAAVVTSRPLFIFTNLEFACIHACPSYGLLKPGDASNALNRVYLLKDSTLEDIPDRIRKTMEEGKGR